MSGRAEANHRVNPNAIRNVKMAFALMALFLGSIVAHAQFLYGSLTGTITEKTGGVIPNVAIPITDQGTGAIRSTTASAVGSYAILNVLPGAYSVSVAQIGNFAGLTQKNVQIKILQPAAVTAQVTVTEAPPMLQPKRIG
jgi:hypothetical protein